MMHPAFTMKSVGVLVLLTVLSSADVTKLQIGIKFKPLKCDFQTHKEDKIKVHYRAVDETLLFITFSLTALGSKE
ncbi:hypothetical protein Bca4012_087052 [Brassica carinata]